MNIKWIEFDSFKERNAEIERLMGRTNRGLQINESFSIERYLEAMNDAMNISLGLEMLIIENFDLIWAQLVEDITCIEYLHGHQNVGYRNIQLQHCSVAYRFLRAIEFMDCDVIAFHFNDEIPQMVEEYLKRIPHGNLGFGF